MSKTNLFFNWFEEHRGFIAIMFNANLASIQFFSADEFFGGDKNIVINNLNVGFAQATLAGENGANLAAYVCSIAISFLLGILFIRTIGLYSSQIVSKTTTANGLTRGGRSKR